VLLRFSAGCFFSCRFRNSLGSVKLTTETDRSLRLVSQAHQPPTITDLSAALIRLEQQMMTLNLNQASMIKSLDEKVIQLNTTIDEKLD
jgi:hypothetical protein